MYACTGAKNRGAKAQSTTDRHSSGDDVLTKGHCLYEHDRRLRCEDEKTSQCNVRVVTFFSEVDKDVVDPR